MSILNITEFDALDAHGRGKNPAVTTQNVSYTTTAASVAFNPRTKWIRVVADADAHIRFGTGTPAAVVTDTRVPADTERYFNIDRGDDVKLAVYDGST